jgi:hypothetical protein
VFSAELAAECTNHMYSDLEGSRSEREEARKLGTYSGAKCSIVESRFPVTANYFVMYLQVNNQVLVNMCINSRAWLYKSTTFFSIRKED